MRKVQKGDGVVVIKGSERGKEGVVKEVLVKGGVVKVGIEGIKMRVWRKKGDKGVKVGEGWIDISNVMVVDKKSGRGVRVGFKIEGGKKARYSKQTKEAI